MTQVTHTLVNCFCLLFEVIGVEIFIISIDCLETSSAFFEPLFYKKNNKKVNHF